MVYFNASPSTLQTEPKFIEMDNIIHLDQKRYNATKKDMTYYLHPYEDEPHRTVHNKNTIGKVMFLTAVAKPRYDDEGNCTFDGKIGIWPFIRKVDEPTCFISISLCYVFTKVTCVPLCVGTR